MPATLTFKSDQLKKLIGKMSRKEQKDISDFLDSILLKARIKRFIDEHSHVPFSVEEIGREVDHVRGKPRP